MSFIVDWPDGDNDLFIKNIIDRIEIALNDHVSLNRMNNFSASPLSLFCSPIKVMEFSLGSMPPSLEILEIVNLDSSSFKGLFKFAYEGDAFIKLETSINLFALFPWKSFQKLSSLITPFYISIQDLRIMTVFTLSLSTGNEDDGLFISFKNGNPLQSLKITTNYDSIINAQKEIETRLQEYLNVNYLSKIIYDYTREIFRKNKKKQKLPMQSNKTDNKRKIEINKEGNAREKRETFFKSSPLYDSLC